MEISILLLVIAVVWPYVSVISLSCYNCVGVPNATACTQRITCLTHEKCFTHMTGTNEKTSFTFGCRSEQNCLSLSDPSSTLVGRKRSTDKFECQQCCAVNDCNSKLCSSFHNVVEASTGECTDDHSVDCAKLTTVFDICNDEDHAKQICKQWCGLCDIVDGHWSAWASWSQCSSTCGNGGTRARNRTCTNPSPAHGGHTCQGSASDSQPCNTNIRCPEWSSWSKWDSCIGATNGVIVRTRTCISSSTSGGTPFCSGPSHESKLCLIRLVNGTSSSGRVEIQHEGTYRTICDDDWDNRDATVVCKMFEFSTGLAKSEAYHGQGSIPIWMVDVACTGNEKSILDCSYGENGPARCTHSEDASVICF